MRNWFALAVSTSLLVGCTINPQSRNAPEDSLATPASQPLIEEIVAPELVPVTVTTEQPLSEPVPVELTPQEESDLWQRIRRQLVMEAPELPRLINQRNWYLRNPSYMERVSKRAEPFMYMIVDEIERRQL